MLTVVILALVLLNGVLLRVVMLAVLLLNGVLLSIVMLAVVLLNGVMLSIVMLSVIMPSVLAYSGGDPKIGLQPDFPTKIILGTA
jgi:hypothetical protein